MSSNPFADPYQSPQPVHFDSPPPAPGKEPAVWFWYVGYCILMALLYFVCTWFGFVIAATEDDEPPKNLVVGIIFAVFCLPLFLLFAAAPFLPRKKFAWYYGFATIGIGFTSCCTLPFCIALLIYWIKPDTKAYLNAM